MSKGKEKIQEPDITELEKREQLKEEITDLKRQIMDLERQLRRAKEESEIYRSENVKLKECIAKMTMEIYEIE